MKVKFSMDKNGYYNYKYSEDDGFELPKCRVCGKFMEVDKVKFGDVAFLCCVGFEDEDNHIDEAFMNYDNGEVEYLGEKYKEDK